MNIYKKWDIFILGICAASIIVICAFFEFALIRLNEDITIVDGIERHYKNSSLYGRVVWEDNFLFKSEMTRLKHPDILVLGSSRVMQFREAFFHNGTFYNAGGTMPSLDAGIHFVRQWEKDYKPKAIVLGVDLWWFNPEFNKQPKPPQADMGSRVFLYKALFDKLKQKAVRLKDIFAANYSGALDPISHLPAIGYRAAKSGGGFRPDGSQQYVEPDDGGWEFKTGFSSTLDRVRRGESGDRFVFAREVDKERIEQFVTLLNLLRQTGAEVVVILPPFAHPVYLELDTNPNQQTFFRRFQKAVAEQCAQQGVALVNFSDLSLLGPDEESVDGFHGSERAYAKIALRLYQSGNMTDFIDSRRIKHLLNSSADPIYIVPPAAN